MTIKQWVESVGGVSAAARLLGTSRQRIYNWCYGKCQPNGVALQNILKLSKGAVTVKGLK